MGADQTENQNPDRDQHQFNALVRLLGAEISFHLRRKAHCLPTAGNASF
jgi:hypothetical protein